MRKITPYNILKGIRYLKHFGPKEFLIRLQERMEPEEIPYGPWYENYRLTEAELEKLRKEKIRGGARFSVIVPLYHTPERFFREMADSVLGGVYDDLELVLVNASVEDEGLSALAQEYARSDPRVRLISLEKNLGIAGNTQAGIEAASGDFVALLDHDDTIDPAALYLMARFVKDHPDTGVLYTDEDKISEDSKTHFQPHLKPDYNPDLLKSNNYICHFLAVRRDVASRAGGFDSRYDGAQDHDLIFRCIRAAKQMKLSVGHVPEILYHWRVSERSTADNPVSKLYAYDAGKAAIEAELEREGLAGEVTLKKDLGFYRVRYQVTGNPLVSIIIPNRDEKETLQRCLDSIREKSAYTNYEIIIVENNSATQEIRDYYRELASDPRIRVLDFNAKDLNAQDLHTQDGLQGDLHENARWYANRKGTVKVPAGSFNYSALNNYGFAHARGEYVILLNNDTEVITPDWIGEMLGVCQRPDTGAVGCRLIYPDGTIQHAGVVIGIGGIAGSMFVDMKENRSGYMHKADLMQDLSAVTAACMMVKAGVYRQVNGFEEKLTVAFNDVDFCLRVREAGYLVVYDPYARLTHFESKSRGTENTKQKVHRFQSEIEYIRTRWTDILRKGDPYYNKNLSVSKWNYSLKDKERMG